MNSNFELIIRWDNAFHHHHISSFPHHKHVGEENSVEESEEMTLEKILSFIQKYFSENSK